jgi:tetratricopeptide (TPR) repeat protein/nucleoside-triphosphatase THEP1
MSAPATGQRVATRPFVGRSAELSHLAAVFQEAASGSGSLVLVTGEAGIGKTRLVQELCTLAAESGGRVLSGRCWEEGGAPAYWPWIQVVRAAGGDIEALAEASSERSLDPVTLRFKLFDGATSFLLAAAREQPLLIALDDVHAADAPSLLLLRFLSESIASHPVLVVASYRDEDPRVREQSDLFAGLLHAGERIRVRGLAQADVAAYVAALTNESPDVAVVERLHRITGGNPFFLGEVTRLLAEALGAAGSDPLVRVPEEVRALIRRRVALLSPEATASLRRAAVVGREFDLPVLQATSTLSAPRLLEVLDEAVAAALLVADPVTQHRYSFVHELVRRALYDDLPASERLELHLSIGRRLEELHAGDLDQHVSLIAHHLTASAPLGHVAEAIDFAVRAGDRAVEVLAYEEAALHYRRALELVGSVQDDSGGPRQRCELLLKLGDAAWRAGDTRSASWAFDDAARLARKLGEPELLARAALGYVTGLGGFLLFARFEAGDTAAELLDEALRVLPTDDSPLRARMLARLAVESYSANEPSDRPLRLSAEAIAMARRLGDSQALVTALHCRHWALATPDLVLERITNSEEMQRVASDTGNLESSFLAHNALLHAALEQCDGAAVDRELAAMSTLAETLRQPFYRWHVTCLRVVRAMLDGRFADAERLADEALRIGALRQSQYADYVFRYAQTLAISWLRGSLVGIAAELRPHAGRYPWIPRWRDALLAADLGDEWNARAEVEQHAPNSFGDLPRDGLWLLHLSTLAECCVMLRDVRRAEELYDLMLPYAERNAISYTLQPFGPVALRLGMIATLLGRWDDADAHFEMAWNSAERLGARSLRPRILYERARSLAARGTPDPGLVAEARRLATELGADGLRQRIDALGEEQPPPADAAEIVFRREGEFWAIGYAGDVVRLRDVKGFHYVAVLAGSPGREVHALELVQAVDGAAPTAGVVDPELNATWGEGTGPVLDAQAKEAYRRRLAELDEELEEARAWQDGERASRVREEIEFLTSELAAAIGFGGRDRETASPAERARISVTKAIKTAIRMIERESPELASHLSSSIQTGRFCRYAPPGAAPPRWQL